MAPIPTNTMESAPAIHGVCTQGLLHQHTQKKYCGICTSKHKGFCSNKEAKPTPTPTNTLESAPAIHGVCTRKHKSYCTNTKRKYCGICTSKHKGFCSNKEAKPTPTPTNTMVSAPENTRATAQTPTNTVESAPENTRASAPTKKPSLVRHQQIPWNLHQLYLESTPENTRCPAPTNTVESTPSN